MSIHLFVRAGVLTERTPAAPNPTVLQKTHTQPSPWRGLRIIWRDTMPNYVCSRRCLHRAHHASSTQSYCLAKDPHPTLSLERAKNYLVRRHAELYLFAPASSPSAPRKQHPILLSCKRPTPNPLPAVANTHWRGLRIVWRDAMPNYVCSRRCLHRANASSTQSYCLAKDPHPTLSLERAKDYLARHHAELCLFALASSPSERQQHPILLSCKRPTPNPLPGEG
jgi:hypothetical protein